MRFDAVIIGGGLSGVIAALRLQKAGRKTALVSAGECTMFLGSGCIGLGPVAAPSETHPYNKIANIEDKVAAIPTLFEEAGVKLHGNGGYRVSPVGNLLPCQWSFAEGVVIPGAEWLKGRKIQITEPEDTLNFPSSIIAARLEALGAEVKIVRPGETAEGYEPVNVLQTPPSLEGFNAMNALRKAYVRAGGILLKGDKVTSTVVTNNKVEAVYTENLGKAEPLQADAYVLATGSFFGKGLVATYTNVYEPLFDADVVAPHEVPALVSDDFYAPQAFMQVGVSTDSHFHVLKDGEVITNLYAVGSILGGADRIAEQSAEGIDILTALAVVEEIENATK